MSEEDVTSILERKLAILEAKFLQMENEIVQMKLESGSLASSSCDDGPTKPAKFPKRIILVRHGESAGNFNENVYCTTPDWKVPLTEAGTQQALYAGNIIKKMIGNEPISVYCSPYLRTKQTLLGIMSHLQDNYVISAREEPRLTEQQFGNFQRREDMMRYKEERKKFGRFYYRFPQGESGLDVYDRVSLFIGTMFREWEKSTSMESNNVMYTVAEFEQTENPPNCAVITMTRQNLVQNSPSDININSLQIDPSVKQETPSRRSSNRATAAAYVLDEECRRILGLSMSKSMHYMSQTPSEVTSPVTSSENLSTKTWMNMSEYATAICCGNVNGGKVANQSPSKLRTSRSDLATALTVTPQADSPTRSRRRRRSVQLLNRNSAHDLSLILDEATQTNDPAPETPSELVESHNQTPGMQYS